MHLLLPILNMQNIYAVWRNRLQSDFIYKDYQMYEAIRLLSIVKEGREQATIDAAEKAVEDLQNNMGELSEMAKFATYTGGLWNMV
jgi:hypothetical protein